VREFGLRRPDPYYAWSMRVRWIYTTTLAGFVATAVALALGYPTLLVLVLALVVFGLAIRGVADPVFDTHYSFASGGLVLGDSWIAFRWAVSGWHGMLVAMAVVIVGGLVVQRRASQAGHFDEA